LDIPDLSKKIYNYLFCKWQVAMTSYLPLKNFALYEPFVITGEPGIFVLTDKTSSRSVIQFKNLYFPEVYTPGGLSQWMDKLVNFNLCDWATSFGAPNNNLPTPTQINAYLLSIYIPYGGSVNPNPTLINWQSADPTVLGNNTITHIDSCDNAAGPTAFVTCAPNIVQFSAIAGQLDFASPELRFPNIPSATKTNMMYYDNVTKLASYGALPGGGLTVLYFDNTPVTIPVNSTNVTMMSFTIPANTFTTVGQVLRVQGGGTATNGGGAAQIVSLGISFNGFPLGANLAMNVPASSITTWATPGFVLTLFNISAGVVGDFMVSGPFTMFNNGLNGGALIAKQYLNNVISVPITFLFSVTTLSACTATQKYMRVTLES